MGISFCSLATKKLIRFIYKKYPDKLIAIFQAINSAARIVKLNIKLLKILKPKQDQQAKSFN